MRYHVLALSSCYYRSEDVNRKGGIPSNIMEQEKKNLKALISFQQFTSGCKSIEKIYYFVSYVRFM